MPYWFIYITALVAACPAALFFYYGIYGRFEHGGLALSFGLLIIGMMLILKAFSKTVVIYFDRTSMYVGDGNRNFKRYLNHEVIGIYSHDYEQRDRSMVSVVIVLKNGHKIYLTDTKLFEQKHEVKAQILRHFLKAAKTRLAFTCIGKNRWRSIQGIGAYWYGNTVPVNSN